MTAAFAGFSAQVWFGVPVPLAKITSVRKVQTRWYFGLGTRMQPRREFYCANGIDAVEVKFSNKQIVLLAMDDVDNLIVALGKR